MNIFMVAHILRLGLLAIAAWGFRFGLPLWWIPAAASALSIFTLFVASRPFSSPLWPVGKLASHASTLLFLLSIPIAIYWLARI